MAVYQGARLRTTAAPAAGITARQARAAAPALVVTTQRVRPMGLLMAAIVAATILGLVYLTQTLGSNATNTEINVLMERKRDIASDITNLQLYALKVSEPHRVIPRAKKQKLRDLGDIDVMSAP